MPTMKLAAVLLLALLPFTAYAEEFTWNLRTNPLGWILGPNLRLDLRMSENWSIGVSGSSTDSRIKEVKLTGATGGVDFSYNFSGAFKPSWFVDAIAGYADLSAQATPNGQIYKEHLYDVIGKVATGYHWYWGHFNLVFDGAVEGHSAGGKTINDQNGNRIEDIPIKAVGVMIEASIGLAF
jgi:hypothetical protein